MDSLSDKEVNEMVANPEPGEDPAAHLDERRRQYPEQAQWLTGRAFYQGRSPEHMDGLFRWALAQARPGTTLTSRNPNPANPSATTAMVRPAPTRIP